MFKNYFKIARRNLWKNKTFTILNLGGLAISLSACLIIFFWVKDELSFDKASPNADRVFRVALTLRAIEQPDKHFAVTAPPLAGVLIKDFPEIEKVIRITPSSMLISYQNAHFFCDRLFYADPGFFEVFGYPLLKGDPRSVLVPPNAVVISETIAKKYFGNQDPVGKTITCNDTILLQVTGVAKDLPANNHFHFDLLVSFAVLGNNGMTSWWNDDFYTYVLLNDAKAAPGLDKKIYNIMDKYNAAQNKAIGFTGLHFLQPIRRIHLHSNLRGELEPNGKITTLRIFIGIGIFLLIVACINYINLTTATSFKRAKEIGMRKVTGAGKSQLAGQFLSESILIVLLALILAIGLAQVGLPFFNRMAGTQISLISHISGTIILVIAVLALILGMLAGMYPALYLSRLNPLVALKKISEKKVGAFSLRKVLVVFQFSLSIILIVSTIVALQQLNYMQSQNLGFDKEQVIAIPLRNRAESSSKEIIKNAFEENAGIVETTASSSTPGKGTSNITVLPEGFPDNRVQTMGTLIVDYDFIQTYKLTLAAGRSFSKDFGDDTTGFILNETAVRELGWGEPKNAIGKKFNWGLGKEGNVIGVAKDFHFNSLQQKITPIVMHLLRDNGWYNFISVRIDTKDIPGAIQSLEASWKKTLPNHPFEYFFVDEDYDKQYRSEQQIGKLSLLFSILIIFISCLGLLGLVMISVSQRVKEIGVRKVLGASAPGIVALLSKNFLKLVAIAILIATPASWWMMNKWLQGFDYRINIGWWTFALAGTAALLIALITVSLQAIKAALANPVKSLRTE